MRHVYQARKRTERSKYSKKEQSRFAHAQLALDVIGDKTTFAARCNALKRIRHVEFTYEKVSLDADAPIAFMEPFSTRHVERFTIDSGALATRMVKQLLVYVSRENPDDVMVEGEDNAGDQHFRLSEAEQASAVATLTPEYLWEHVRSGFSLSDLLSLKVHDRLIEVFNENKTIQTAVKSGGPPK